MRDFAKRIASLSPGQRKLFELRVKERGINISKTQIMPQESKEGVFPLSFAQQRLWFLDQFEPDNSVYNMPFATLLRGSPNVDAFEQSLRDLVQRHEILRTTFVTLNGEPAQIIATAPSPTVAMPEVDLQELSEAEQEAEVKRLATEEARSPFDLTRGPLLRTKLVHLGEEQHIFFVTMHHIVSDGWSVGIFVRELATLYEIHSRHQLPSLPELPIQYADFAVWQREWLQGDVLEKQVEYWRQQLANLLVLDLPTDRPRPSIQSYRGATFSFKLSKKLSEELKALSYREEVTLFMTLLAAWKTLLHRYSGQDDLAVGSPIANRNRPELEGLIGFFVNTLVLRTDLSGNPSFRELLGRVRQVCLAAYVHQDVPFEKLVEELRPERDLSRSPLFQVMFALQNAQIPTWELLGLTLTPFEVDSGTARFDLMLSMIDTGQELKASFEYNTDLFDQATIERMTGYLLSLLEGIIVDPERRLAELPLLSREERLLLLEERGRGLVEIVPDVCVHELLQAQVKRVPEAIAVAVGEEQLTYLEWDKRANQLAHYLQSLGVGPEMLVGICVRRSLEMTVGLQGILKAGGAYVPLDLACPQERLAFMLADTKTQVLVTEEHLQEQFSEYEGKVVLLDRDWPMIATLSEEKPQSDVGLDDLAYVMYTSGSTGKPKGVQVTHRGLVNFFHSMGREPGLTRQDVLMAVTTLSFDIAALELYLPLTAGGRVVLASREEAMDGELLHKRLGESGVTVMQATPVTWRLLLDAGWQGGEAFKLLCGGEAMAANLARRLVETGAAVWNLYGPTETTVWSSLQKVDGQPTADPVPLGSPIANTQIYVLDRCLEPVPTGAIGEVYIGGRGLARGYLHRPDLTAESFVPDLFAERGGERLYRTGDLARFRVDGVLVYMGRVDHQVKLRGFRIELGEIEAALREHAVVQEAVVLVREDVLEDKRLVGYVVVDSAQSRLELVEGGVSQKLSYELREFLQAKLPNYMVPTTFIFLDVFPLTPNGKVDRKSLPVPDGERPELKETYVAPRTPVEEEIARVFAQVLGIDKVGIYDDFFNLGGHSLLATRLVAQIRDAYHIHLPLRGAFLNTNVASLASAVEEAQRRAERAAVSEDQRLRELLEGVSDEQVDLLLGDLLASRESSQSGLKP